MDLYLFQTPDGGDLEIINGTPTTDEGLFTGAYLSLFGGNQDDSGSDADKPNQWWANTEEPDESKRYRSELQHLLLTLPLVPASLRAFQEAATRDLAWMITAGLATFAGAVASMPALNTVRLTISIEANGKVLSKPFDWVKKQ